jgi:hypothetical protein
MILYNDVYGDGLKGILSFTHLDLELYQECLQWNELAKGSHFDAYKMTRIGRFKGVRPLWVGGIVYEDDGMQMKVEFEVEDYDPPSWMDWFDVKGENDGVLEGNVGTVINERTCPQYFVDGKYIFDKEN